MQTYKKLIIFAEYPAYFKFPSNFLKQLKRSEVFCVQVCRMKIFREIVKYCKYYACHQYHVKTRCPLDLFLNDCIAKKLAACRFCRDPLRAG